MMYSDIHIQATDFQAYQKDNSVEIYARYQSYIEGFYLKNQKNSYIAAGWSQKQLLDSLSQHRCYFLLKNESSSLEKNIIGLAIWQIIPDERYASEAELLMVEIDAQHRKQGWAQFLLTSNLDDLKQKNCQTFFLEVRESNLAAQKLYQKLEFKVVGRRKNYYPALELQTREDAIIMKYTSDS